MAQAFTCATFLFSDECVPILDTDCWKEKKLFAKVSLFAILNTVNTKRNIFIYAFLMVFMVFPVYCHITVLLVKECSLMDNKQTGSFYTPMSLIEYMVGYARTRIAPHSILEPSAGDGRFVQALQSFMCPITLVEYEEHKVANLKDVYSDSCEIFSDDYLNFSINCNSKYDLIIGNPPYISKKKLPQAQRDLSLKLLDCFDLPHDLFQNIWVSFILAALKNLSPNGAIFFVLPFEFLQVQYAEKLREFLEGKFNTIEITTFEDRVFPEIEQDICLVYLCNEQQGKPYIKYTTLVSDTDPKKTFESIILRNKPLKKWSNCILNDMETETLLKTSALFPKIKSFGKIAPGIVTGANSYFVLSKKAIDALNIPDNLELPILTKGSYVPSLLLLKLSDFQSIEAPKRRTRLLNLHTAKEETFSQKLISYLEDGKEKKIHERYKCGLRKRWFDVPIVNTGGACFFKRFHKLPKLIVNEAGVHTTDVSYNIRFNASIDPASFVFCFYNSLTLALCEYNGRFYGGGVGELVPSEFKDLCIPYREISKDKIIQLDQLFRNNSTYTDIIDYVDSIVLADLPHEVIVLLQKIRNRYLTRRMKLYCREDGTLGE